MDIYEVRDILGDEELLDAILAWLSSDEKQEIANDIVSEYDLDIDLDSDY